MKDHRFSPSPKGRQVTYLLHQHSVTILKYSQIWHQQHLRRAQTPPQVFRPLSPQHSNPVLFLKAAMVCIFLVPWPSCFPKLLVLSLLCHRFLSHRPHYGIGFICYPKKLIHTAQFHDVHPFPQMNCHFLIKTHIQTFHFSLFFQFLTIHIQIQIHHVHYSPFS